MKKADSWKDLADAFTNDTLKHFTSIYDSPDDIDLWTAGVSERPLTGSMVGPVFGCIIGESFKDLRAGDRFWHENPNQPSSFTVGQFLNFIVYSPLLKSFQKLTIFDFNQNQKNNCKKSVMCDWHGSFATTATTLKRLKFTSWSCPIPKCKSIPQS